MLRGNKSDKKLVESIYDTKLLWAQLCVFPKYFCLALRSHEQLAVLHPNAGANACSESAPSGLAEMILHLAFFICDVSTWILLVPQPKKKKKAQLTPKIAPTSGKIRTLYRSSAAADSSHPKCNLPDPICPNWHYSEAMAGELWMTFFYWALLQFQSSREQTSSLLQERAFLSKAWHTPQGRRSVKQNLFRW